MLGFRGLRKVCGSTRENEKIAVHMAGGPDTLWPRGGRVRENHEIPPPDSLTRREEDGNWEKLKPSMQFGHGPLIRKI